MPVVNAQLDRDAEIWRQWVDGSTQAEIARRRGLDQTTVSAAVNRYSASIPEPEKTSFRERALSRLEELYQAHREAALIRPRTAAVVRAIVMDEARLLGLIQSQNQVHVDGMVEHAWQPGPTLEELMERWRRDGSLKAQITRTDP